MFFIWGAQRQRRTFSNVEDHYCPNCGRDQPCIVVLNYTVRHFWFALRWVTGKTYHAVCNVCHSVTGRLNTKIFEARLKKKPIPFFDRMSWLVSLGVVFALVPLSLVYAEIDKKNVLELLNAPRAGDIYEIDSGPSGDSSCADCRYGTALVNAVDDKAVHVRFSKRVYNTYSGASEFASGPSAREPDAYLAETYSIPRQKLVEMRQKGDMIGVIR